MRFCFAANAIHNIFFETPTNVQTDESKTVICQAYNTKHNIGHHMIRKGANLDLYIFVN
jgi:hypothetical protein